MGAHVVDGVCERRQADILEVHYAQISAHSLSAGDALDLSVLGAQRCVGEDPLIPAPREQRRFGRVRHALPYAFRISFFASAWSR